MSDHHTADDRLLAFADQLRRGESEEREETERAETWVSFVAGGRSFALPVGSVREVARTPKLTKVPGAPPAVSGVTSLRGHSIAVVDLERLLDLPHHDAEHESHLLVVQHEGRSIALLVDHVERVLDVLPSRIAITSTRGADSPHVGILGSYESEGRALTLLASDFLAAAATQRLKPRGVSEDGQPPC